MPRPYIRMRLAVALVCSLLLTTSCGSLTSVRGDDIYYTDSHTKSDKKKDKNKDKKKNKNNNTEGKSKKDRPSTHKKDSGHSTKSPGKGGKGDGGGSSTPFRIPQDLDESTLALIREALSWIGTPYVYGGESKEGADCSGFVMMTYKNALGIKLPRTSADQGEFVESVDKNKLEIGDLVFFRTGSSDRVSHVGIYVGDGKFIHASSTKGVMISDLDMKYFAERYHHSGKVTQFRRLRSKK